MSGPDIEYAYDELQGSDFSAVREHGQTLFDTIEAQREQIAALRNLVSRTLIAQPNLPQQWYVDARQALKEKP